MSDEYREASYTVPRGPSYQYAARLMRVIDGDTIDLTIDLGFRVTIQERIRLLGVDAPERGKPGADIATAWLTEELAGKTIVVETRKADGFRRWLGTLWVNDKNVNEAILAAGIVTPYEGRTGLPIKPANLLDHEPRT